MNSVGLRKEVLSIFGNSDIPQILFGIEYVNTRNHGVTGWWKFPTVGSLLREGSVVNARARTWRLQFNKVHDRRRRCARDGGENDCPLTT